MKIGVRSAFKKQCGVASCRDHRIVVPQDGLCRNQAAHGIRQALSEKLMSSFSVSGSAWHAAKERPDGAGRSARSF